MSLFNYFEPLACFVNSPFCLKVLFYELLVCNPDIGYSTVDGSLPTSTLRPNWCLGYLSL